MLRDNIVDRLLSCIKYKSRRIYPYISVGEPGRGVPYLASAAGYTGAAEPGLPGAGLPGGGAGSRQVGAAAA